MGIIVENPFSLPMPPSKPSCDVINKHEVRVKWNKLLDSGGLPIICYKLEFKGGEKRRHWKSLAQVGPHQLIYLATNLAENKTYCFRVFSENETGMSEPSDPSDGFTTKDPVELP